MPRELVPVDPKVTIPKVVDESGKAVESGDDYLEIVQIVTQMAQTAQLARIRLALERPQVHGRLEPRMLNATDVQGVTNFPNTKWPYVPLATIDLHNYGPNAVRISVNSASDWFVLEKGEGEEVDFSNADDRIRKVYHICNPGETATVKLVGKW